MNNRKYILFILTLFYFGTVKAQFTNIPDPIFEEYLISIGLDSDGTINGQVLTSDIDSETLIQLNESPPFFFITDFTGIEDFASLEVFVFNVTNVTELDFGDLNNLRSVVAISNNDLTFIDISECESLETFIMSGTSINTLLLPQTTTLENFSVNSGSLTVLDLSAYPNLSEVQVDNQELQTLNVANGNNLNFTLFTAINNPNLQCIIVDDADYSMANWTNIDSTSTFVETQEECDALSTDYFSFIELKMYPNPTTDFFHLETDLEISKIDVFDLNGKTVKSFKTNPNGYDVSELSNGIYIIKIESGLSSITQKLIIE